MFNALRQCRCLIPLAKMAPIGGRQLSTQHSFMIPSCSTIMTTRSSSYVKTMLPNLPPKQLTPKEAETRVIKAIKAWDRFPQEKTESLTMDTRFVEDLSLDSLDLVEVTMALEDEFGFEFSEDKIDTFKTLRDVYKFVCKHEDVKE